MKIKRVFHHYKLCEEYNSNMWRVIPIDQRPNAIDSSANLMIDAALFELACKRAIDEWPYSSEAALTASTMNHQAWIGHAACALNHGAPEDLTRLGWRTLTEQQQDDANAAADRAIAYWKEKYVFNLKNKQV